MAQDTGWQPCGSTGSPSRELVLQEHSCLASLSTNPLEKMSERDMVTSASLFLLFQWVVWFGCCQWRLYRTPECLGLFLLPTPSNFPFMNIRYVNLWTRRFTSPTPDPSCFIASVSIFSYHFINTFKWFHFASVSGNLSQNNYLGML